MKHIMIYAMLLSGVAFAACDEVEDMTGKPQVNEPVSGYDISSLQVSSPVGDAVSLPDMNSAGNKEVAVVEVTSPGNLPEGYELRSVYVVSDAEDFATPYSIDVAFPEESTTGYVSTAQLEEAYEALIGLKSDPVEFYGHAELYAVNAKNSVIRIGGDDAYYAAAKFMLTPDPAFVLYTPGGSNGWDGASSMQLPSTDGKNYSGFAYLDGEFKLTTAPGWDGTNYGASGEEGRLSTAGDTGNLSVATPGLYWVSVNTSDLTYSMTNIATLGAIGSFNDWGGDAELSPNENMTVWTGEVTFSGEGEWKIRANNDWAISFGTSLEDMTYNGANLPDPGVGVYLVTFDVGSVPYKAMCTLKP